MSLTVGTAGHIDHGKTWLVLPDGMRLSVVDVPGHERFVRTMVAGATGIDLFLLVIDAAEGARPQTHEHLAILRLLGVETGVVAVTKADAVDEETLELAVLEAQELVPDAEVVAVSARTGAGLDDLRAAISHAAAGTTPRTIDRPTRLYVDRVFTLHGIGTVVTGTLWSGTVRDGDELVLEPGGRDLRVRSVQVHDEPVERAEAGRRVALSLPGVDREEVSRGAAIVAASAYPVSYRLDVTLDELQPLADNARLSVHHGTRRIPARVARIGLRHAQLRLAEPVVAARGDRVVLRGATTVAGGLVVDPAPPRHRDADRLELIERGEIAAAIDAPVHVSALRHVLDGELDGIERAGPWAFSTAWREALEGGLRERLERADSLDPGVPVPSEPWAAEVVARLPFERRGARLYLPGAVASLGARQGEADALEATLAAAGMAATKVDDAELARFLERDGHLVRLGDGYVIGPGGYEVARDVVVTECRAAGEITLGRFRDLVGTGRRDAQLLLERLDQDGLTRRVGDKRVLRRAARTAPS